MRIVVLGAGGVGGYFGGRLAAAGSDVTFVARGAHLNAIKASGRRIVSPLADVVVEAKAVDDIAAIDAADLIIVAVKLWDTEIVAPALKPLVARGAAVVSFQNGVTKDDILRAHLPADAVLGGVSYIAARIAEPGVIEHTGTMQRLVFGEFDGNRSQRTQSFLQACEAAKIDAECSGAIDRVTWEKFVFLVGLSGSTSFFRQPIGEIRVDPEKRAFLHGAMQETVAVGLARGVPLDAALADDRLAFSDTLPAAMTSSMYTDLVRGNRLELPWLSGAVVEMGKARGIPTPINDQIVRALAAPC